MLMTDSMINSNSSAITKDLSFSFFFYFEVYEVGLEFEVRSLVFDLFRTSQV